MPGIEIGVVGYVVDESGGEPAIECSNDSERGGVWHDAVSDHVDRFDIRKDSKKLKRKDEDR